jgi:pantoate--beta-alanine ligase
LRDDSAADGLALSSRNAYLASAERAEAPRLYQLLCKAREELMAGAIDYQRIELDVMSDLAHHGWKPDYIAVRRQADLTPPTNGERKLVVLAAARLGKTRLIDNVEVERG